MLGCRVLASAKTAPLFEFYYQFIRAGLIRVVYHRLGFIHCRKIAVFRSFLERVASAASRVADTVSFAPTFPLSLDLPPETGHLCYPAKLALANLTALLK